MLLYEVIHQGLFPVIIAHYVHLSLYYPYKYTYSGNTKCNTKHKIYLPLTKVPSTKILTILTYKQNNTKEYKQIYVPLTNMLTMQIPTFNKYKQQNILTIILTNIINKLSTKPKIYLLLTKIRAI